MFYLFCYFMSKQIIVFFFFKIMSFTILYFINSFFSDLTIKCEHFLIGKYYSTM